MNAGLPAIYFNKIKEWFTTNFVTSVNGNKGDVTVNVGTLIPSGAIMWFNLSSAPDGWKVCDGTNGTPNLIGSYPLGATSGIGSFVEAGLPNIEGEVASIVAHAVVNPVPSGKVLGVSGAFKSTDSYIEGSKQKGEDAAHEGESAPRKRLIFNANNSNSIYGKSSTVTPPSVKLLPCQKI